MQRPYSTIAPVGVAARSAACDGEAGLADPRLAETRSTPGVAPRAPPPSARCSAPAPRRRADEADRRDARAGAAGSGTLAARAAGGLPADLVGRHRLGEALQLELADRANAMAVAAADDAARARWRGSGRRRPCRTAAPPRPRACRSSRRPRPSRRPSATPDADRELLAGAAVAPLDRAAASRPRTRPRRRRRGRPTISPSPVVLDLLAAGCASIASRSMREVLAPQLVGGGGPEPRREAVEPTRSVMRTVTVSTAAVMRVGRPRLPARRTLCGASCPRAGSARVAWVPNQGSGPAPLTRRRPGRDAPTRSSGCGRAQALTRYGVPLVTPAPVTAALARPAMPPAAAACGSTWGAPWEDPGERRR